MLNGGVSQDLLDVPEISEAVTLSEEAVYTVGELNSYEEYWDAVRTEKTLMLGRFEEGKAEGFEEGLEEGEAKGIAKGILEGEQKKAIGMARLMILQQMPLSVISSVSGLSEEFLATLK